MKAAVCYEFGQPLEIEDLELFPPQKGEVKVKLAACAICHSDIHYAEGAWGGTLPAVYGHEAAGVVEEIGEGVSSVKIGDHVIVSLIRYCGCCYHCNQGEHNLCETVYPLDEKGRLETAAGKPVLQGLNTGAFAEYVVVDQSQAVSIPKDIPLESASLIACGVVTGFGAVTRTAKVPTGSSAVVIGTGGVGLNSIQGATLTGAQPIIAIDLLESKLTAAKTFGATHTINSTKNDALETVKELTEGRGADYVFVTVGSAKAMAQGLSLIRRGGTLCLVGMPASGVRLEIEATEFAGNIQTVLGSKMGTVCPSIDMPKLIKLYQQGRLKLDELITERYPLEEINEAIAAVNRGEALRNVIVF